LAALGERDLVGLREHLDQLEADGVISRTFRRLDPDRQGAVIDALLEEAAEHGPTGLAVKRVAARAGVATGSLYQYFPRRDGMLDFAVDVVARTMARAIGSFAPMLAALPLREGLEAFLAGGVAWSRELGPAADFFARCAYQGEPRYQLRLVEPVGRALRELLLAILGAARERGELRADLELEVAARFVQATTTVVGDAELLPHLATYLQLFDETHPPARVRREVVDLVLRAVAPSSSEEGP